MEEAGAGTQPCSNPKGRPTENCENPLPGDSSSCGLGSPRMVVFEALFEASQAPQFPP